MKKDLNSLIMHQAVIYQGKSGAIELKGDFEKETIWASQIQIAEIFKVERSVITKHIRNILKDKELIEDSVCAKLAHTAEDGKVYQVQHYSLDVILAVGYRTNSSRAIQFRQWATKTLRAHIVDGYSINKKRLAKNYSQFLKAVDDIKILLPEASQFKVKEAMDLVELFASTWFSLNAYDKTAFPKTGITKRKVFVTAEQLTKALGNLKEQLIKKKEATELFAQEKQSGSIESIIGNIFQSFARRDLYPSLEEKAAHLLYFFVKNHPFNDGNKRSGAFAFVWFLQKAKMLQMNRLTPEALTALTLLIAESNPKDKDRMIGLILLILRKSDDEKIT